VATDKDVLTATYAANRSVDPCLGASATDRRATVGGPRGVGDPQRYQLTASRERIARDEQERPVPAIDQAIAEGARIARTAPSVSPRPGGNMRDLGKEKFARGAGG
jgi:hypothetical protein